MNPDDLTMTDEEALAEAVLVAAGQIHPSEGRQRKPDDGFEWYGTADEMASDIAAALTASGYSLVRSDELLDIARIAGADLSDITDPAQIVHPSLVEFVTEEVSVLREAYRECLAAS